MGDDIDMIKQILQNGQRTGMTMREITDLTDLKQHQVDFQMQKLIKSGEVIKSEDRIDGAYLYKLADYSPAPAPVVEVSPVRLDNVIKHLNKQKELVNAGAPVKTSEAVNSPPHYNSGKVECIDAIESMLTKEEFIGYLRGNILKYQWRYKLKNGAEDIKKAQWYLNRLIATEGF
jgi:predicted transcriptional regulator